MFKGMIGKILAIFVLFSVVVQVNVVHGDEETSWNSLNHRSDTILKYVKQGHYQEAATVLEGFSETFLQLRSSEQGLSMRDLQVITSTYDHATHAVKSASLSHEERVQNVYQLRLLMDVYVQSHKPLWQNMQDPLIMSLRNLHSSTYDEDVSISLRLDKFLAHYETVKPAWSVGLPDEKFQRINSQVQYLIGRTGTSIDQGKWDELIDLIEMELLSIFTHEGVKEEVSDPSLYWLIITISSAIFSSLTYVGWKKYRAQQLRDKIVKKQKRGQ